MNNPPEADQEPIIEMKGGQILGLSTDELAGVSVEEIIGNKTAVTMIMHYYKVLQDQNTTLRNDLNTAKGYVDGYRTKKVNSTVGAVLLLLSNIFIGFGINLFTSNKIWLGFTMLIPGICMAGVGLYFSIKES